MKWNNIIFAGLTSCKLP